ncbi:MAG: PH domain-containing protein [Chloroflexota bacterium]|nr:MAG: PH domain-containing protein [Chloroflexota bacterium]
MARYIESLLGEREKIILIAHQHWFILVRAIVFEIILILILITLMIIAGGYLPQFALLIGAVGAILILLPLSTLIRDVLDWTNRQYIVTNRRVIQISGVLNKNVMDSSLVKVTDVKMAQSAFGRLFNYGDIEILTASELGVNLFRRIGEPIIFKTAMLNAKERLEQGENLIPPTEDIFQIIASLDRLLELGILTEEEFKDKKEGLLARL